MKIRINKQFLGVSCIIGLVTGILAYKAMKIGASTGSQITLDLVKALAHEDIIKATDIPDDLSGL